LPEPFVSVVTPFHNTAPYLAQCIESVLAQSYTNFEYVLVDNCSADGSGDIAAEYARRDPRIRFVRRSQLLSQIQNYNAALAEISASSRYCKIVQADDYIFPDCLRLMVLAFEQSESVGLVSAYDLKGDMVRGSGFPCGTSTMAGREVARLCLQKGVFVFGSPTTVMYRSSIVQSQQPFYDESLLHEDTEKCLQILQTWDFGFVYQVLSFLRIDNVNQSISGSVRSLEPIALDRYIQVQRYASKFLDEPEASALKKEARRNYYDVLAAAALHLRGKEFWEYHKSGLKTLGETLDRPYLALQLARRVFEMCVNPGETVRRVLRLMRPRASKMPTTRSHSAERAVANVVTRPAATRSGRSD
jgi:glycosyltransferase involved in cell wall biosynthesis